MTEVAQSLAVVKPAKPSCRTDRENSAALGRVRSLTTEICKGNEEAFDEFYSEYSPRIYRFLLVVTKGNEELTRELHQRVMIKAAQKMKVFGDDGELWAWLAEVARNCWKDHLRKAGRETRLLEERWNEIQSSAREADDHLACGFEAAMQMLSGEERALLNQFYYDELAQKEIGEKGGRTVKAVQCELARIRKKLKAYILKAL